MSEIVRVPFHGDDILTVEVEGKPWIILKPAVEALGIDYWTQVEKLRSRSWASTSQRPVQLPGDNQRRDVVTCDVRTFLMLLATIDERRVAVDVKPRLITYQAEVAEAIESYWTGASATWLMLAEHVAAMPSSFKTSEIRAIVRAVIEIAESTTLDESDVDAVWGDPA